LADGIFAIAMTLLVLSLVVPDAPASNVETALNDYLQEDWNKFLNFVKSFLLLAIFWIVHHRIFATIKRTDEGFLWLNIFALMFVALVPFSATLEGEYSNIQIAAAIFDLNLLAIGICYFLIVVYASRGHRLIAEDISREQININYRRGLVVPAVSLMALGLTFISPGWSSMAYLLIPFIMTRL
jgi:uncharacterized membrane protein